MRDEGGGEYISTPREEFLRSHQKIISFPLDIVKSRRRLYLSSVKKSRSCEFPLNIV